MWRTWLTVALGSISLIAACSDPPISLRSTGDACAADDECSSNLCYESTCFEPTADEDLDGLTNQMEARLQTKVTEADSDGDGLSDFEEVGERYDDPPDADGDGIIDALESTLLSADEDGDCVAPQADGDDAEVDDLNCCCGESCRALGVEVADIVDYVCDQETGQVTCVFSSTDDLDGDGLLPMCDDDDDGDDVDDGDDCAPEDPTRAPGIEELCDGVDNDCDGGIDEAWPELKIECLTAHLDCGGSDVFVCNDSQDGVVCPIEPALPGTLCDDGNPQTTDDVCDAAGNCAGMLCPDGGACTSVVIEDGVCVYLPLSGMCFIDGECYVDGAAKPQWPCKACDPAASQDSWSTLEVGVPCDDASACTVGDVCGPEGVCQGEALVTDDCMYDCAVTDFLVGISPTAASNASGHAVFFGDFAYVLQSRENNGDGIELSIVDMSDGTEPKMVELPNLQTGGLSNSGALNDVNFPRRGLINAPGDYLYISSATGLQVVDVTDPSQAQTVKTQTINGQLYGLAHHPYESVIYAAAITWGGVGSFVAINIASSPDWLNSTVHATEFDVETYGVAVGSDNRAYLVGADLSLQWFDISAPMQPSLVGTLSGIEAPSNDAEALVAVHGGLAVAASTRDGYRLVDVSNGSDVTVLYEGATPSKIFGVAFFESYLVFASEDQGLVVVDIAQPSNPSVVATIGLGGVPRGVHVKDHRVFVSTSAHFLKVIDLTLPCLDDDLCTVDGCLVDAGCTIVADTACDDLDPCTVDSCDPYEGCIYTEDMTCTEAGADPP